MSLPFTTEQFFGVFRRYNLAMWPADGTPVLTPWIARLSGDYMRVDGMTIPGGGEAEWVLPEGPLPYWRGHVVGADYEYAP